MTKTNLDSHGIEHLCKTNGITRRVVFGSRVRGEAAKSSGLDLIADLPAEASLLGLLRIEREFSSNLGRPVVSAHGGLHPPHIRQNILDELRLLCEAD